MYWSGILSGENLFTESNATVAGKFQAAQNSGLTPILCVGETLQQRQQEQTVAVVAAQIKAVIDSVGLHNVCRAVVAYEPVWAIGTGETASPEQAQQVHRGDHRTDESLARSAA